MQSLPNELIGPILILLAKWDPVLAFKVATQFRLLHIQAQILPRVISIDSASARGHLPVLHILGSQPKPKRYSASAMDYASKNGHVVVLDWWRSAGIRPLLWSEAGMDGASANGYVEVLDWWKHSGLTMRWSTEAMDSASENGHVHVLKWWKSSGVQMMWSKEAIDGASRNGHVHVLEWWKSSGLKLVYSTHAIYWALFHRNMAVLEWWQASGLEMRLDSSSFITSSLKGVARDLRRDGRTDILYWWLQSGFEIPGIPVESIAKFVEESGMSPMEGGNQTVESSTGQSGSGLAENLNQAVQSLSLHPTQAAGEQSTSNSSHPQASPVREGGDHLAQSQMSQAVMGSKERRGRSVEGGDHAGLGSSLPTVEAIQSSSDLRPTQWMLRFASLFRSGNRDRSADRSKPDN